MDSMVLQQALAYLKAGGGISTLPPNMLLALELQSGKWSQQQHLQQQQMDEASLLRAMQQAAAMQHQQQPQFAAMGMGGPAQAFYAQQQLQQQMQQMQQAMMFQQQQQQHAFGVPASQSLASFGLPSLGPGSWHPQQSHTAASAAGVGGARGGNFGPLPSMFGGLTQGDTLMQMGAMAGGSTMGAGGATGIGMPTHPAFSFAAAAPMMAPMSAASAANVGRSQASGGQLFGDGRAGTGDTWMDRRG